MSSTDNKAPKNATAIIVFADGKTFYGKGLGAEVTSVGEICFNTSLTGYQEILTDLSYAGEIITLHFSPYRQRWNQQRRYRNNYTSRPAARLSAKTSLMLPAGAAAQHLNEWLKTHNLPGICGIDTRAMTRHIRDNGAPNAVICHQADGKFDLDALKQQAAEWPGLEGMDLAKEVSCTQTYTWDETNWDLETGYGKQTNPEYHVVAMDFGAKRNILRCLASAGCKVTVVPANTSAEDVLKHKPDGVFLSNGPGDPAATGEYAVPAIKTFLDKNLPVFGICLGHQMLALAMGGETTKMHLGHRGANHPVQDLTTTKVEITSQNHGFMVIPESLPDDVEVTHISLFDKTNEGIKHKNQTCFQRAIPP